MPSARLDLRCTVELKLFFDSLALALTPRAGNKTANVEVVA